MLCAGTKTKKGEQGSLLKFMPLLFVLLQTHGPGHGRGQSVVESNTAVLMVTRPVC